MAKTLSRRAVQSAAPVRVKTTVTLTADTFRRLGAACVAEDMTQSEIAEWLFSRHLSGYFVGNKGSRVGDSPDPRNRAVPVPSNDRPADADPADIPADAAA